MKKKLTKTRHQLFAIFLFLPFLAFTSLAFEITIDIAPNVLNVASSGTVVTVHTNLPYSSVLSSSLTLDGVQIESWKADDRGYFVAKFEMSAIKSLPLAINQHHTFMLTGFTKDGQEFSGIQSILIIDKTGK